MSITNAQETSVTLTFRFRPSVAVSSAYIDIRYPTNFQISGNKADGVWRSSITSISANSDQQIQVTGVTNPQNPGGYGPFGIVIRRSTDLQIVDVNRAFASVYISDALQTDGALLVNPYRATVATINESVALNFRFAVNIDMWPHDMFVVYTDDDWTTPQSPTCESLSGTTTSDNYFVATDGTHTLECVADKTKGIVYVYGLADRIDISQAGGDSNSLDINLKIGNYVAPIADYSTSQYTWKVTINAWHTQRAFARYSGTGPETQPGSLTIFDWKPHNGYKTANLIQGLILYMDLQLVTSSQIPDSGRLEINFGNVSIHDTNWKVDKDGADVASTGYFFMEWIGVAYTYTVAAGKVTIDFTGDVPANTMITITTLTNFTGLIPIVSAVAYLNSSNVVIDQSNTYQLSYNSSSNIVRAFDFKFVIANIGGTTQNNYSYTRYNPSMYLHFMVQPKSTDFTATTTASTIFYLPISIGKHGDFGFYVYSQADQGVEDPVQLQYGTIPVATITHFTPSSSAATYAVVGVSTIQSANTLTFASGQGKALYSFFNSSDGTISAKEVVTPYVESNLATRQETWAEMTIGSITYVRFQRLYYSAQDGSGITVGITNNCDLLSVSLAGMITNMNYSMQNVNRSYYIEVTITGASTSLGTNFSVGSEIPFVNSSGFDSDLKVLLSSGSTNGAFKLANQSSLVSTTTYSLFLALEPLANAGFESKVYFVDNQGDPSVQYTISKETGVTINNASNDTSGTVKTLQINQTFDAVLAQPTLALSQQWFFLTLGQGFMFDQQNSKMYLGEWQSSNPVYILQGSDYLYQSPTIISQMTPVTSTDTLTVTNIKAAPYQIPGATVKFSWDPTAAACIRSDQLYQTVFDEIEDIQIWPKEVRARSSESVNVTLTVQFVSIHGIPSGGRIEMVLDSTWQVLGACTTEGLEVLTGAVISCTLSGMTWTISNFKTVDPDTAIRVNFAKTLPPVNNSGEPFMSRQLVSIKTIVNAYGADRDIDQRLNYNVLTCRVLLPANPGFSVVVENDSFPPNANEQNADAYVHFRFTHFIPATSTVELKSPAGNWVIQNTDIPDSFYLSEKYTTVTISGNTLSIVTAEDIEASKDIYLYIEKAFNIPASQSAATYYDFTVTYNSITIIDDSENTITTPHHLIVQPAIATAIEKTTVGLALNTYNFGETATYTFQFVPHNKYEIGDEFRITFPRVYSPYIGKAVKRHPFQYPNRYYINCASEDLGEASCEVDRWNVFMKGSLVVENGKAVTLKIYDVQNPRNGDEALVSGFHVYHIGKDGAIKSALRNYATLELQKQAGDVLIRNVSAEDNSIFSTTDYRFDFYINGEIDQWNEFVVYLPEQYSTKYQTNDQELTCSLSWINQEDDILEPQEVSIVANSACPVFSNLITLGLPANTSYNFSKFHQLILKVDGVRNPQWGRVRAPDENFSWDFDANDFNVFPYNDVWTNQIEVLVLDKNENRYSHRSYANANAAYLGFTKKYRSFSVNGYVPETDEGHIVVRQGLQTKDLFISTGGPMVPLSSKWVKFMPETAGVTDDAQLLSYTSRDYFRMYHLENRTQFRVGASALLSVGYYYVNWEIDEEHYSSEHTDLYNAPVKTLLEVTDNFKDVLQVGDIPPIPIDSSSAPIPISVEFSPHTRVSIKVSSSSSEIDIIPQSVDLYPDVNVKYFQIIVKGSYELDSELKSAMETLRFEVSGPDQIAYEEMDEIMIQIVHKNELPDEAAQVLNFNHNVATRTTIKLNATCDSNGYFLYYIGAKGTEPIDAIELNSMIGDYFDLDTSINPPEEEEEEKEVEPSEDDLANPRLEGWVAFSRRKYKEHLQQTWYGAKINAANESTELVALDELYAETVYEAWAYCKNAANLWSEASHLEFDTAPMAEPGTLELYFPGEVTANYESSLRNVVASTIGCAPERMLNSSMNSFRRLQSESSEITSTVLTWDLPVDRNVEAPTPTQEGILSDEEADYLAAEVATLGITLPPTFTFITHNKFTYNSPKWRSDAKPSAGTITQSTVELVMQTTTTGEVCCVVSLEAPSTTQVLLGLNSKNEIAKNACVGVSDLSEPVSVSFNGLSSGTTYDFYCVAYNSYPLWPVAMKVNKEEPLEKVSVVTETVMVEEDDDDFARFIGAMWVVVLVFIS